LFAGNRWSKGCPDNQYTIDILQFWHYSDRIPALENTGKVPIEYIELDDSQYMHEVVSIQFKWCVIWLVCRLLPEKPEFKIRPAKINRAGCEDNTPELVHWVEKK